MKRCIYVKDEYYKREYEKRMFWKQVVFCIVAFVVVAILFGCAKKALVKTEPNKPQTYVKVAKAVVPTPTMVSVVNEPRVVKRAVARKNLPMPVEAVEELNEALEDQGWQYVVEKGDCLWKIAGQEMQDNFLWPMLWRHNRDQIEDPDVIEIGQDLYVPMVGENDLEEGLAVLTAKQWPKYRKK